MDDKDHGRQAAFQLMQLGQEAEPLLYPFPRQGEWEGRIYLSPYQESVIIVAVVAPPTSQELFRLYAQSLSERKKELPLRPLTRIPAEIKNFA